MKMNKEDKQFLDQLEPFENKWVALSHNEVVAYGESVQEVTEKAEAHGYTDYSLFLVPSFSASLAPSGL